MNYIPASKSSLILGSLIFIASCVSTPTERFDQFAIDAGLFRSIIKSESFNNVLYSKHSLTALRDQPILHLYLGGDGTPWITPNHKSGDPTPRIKTGLNLMLVDPSPSIYLGRPCYHQLIPDKNCGPKWWTSHRYADEILQAMIETIKSISSPNQTLRLFGFSGGGSLAMLLAERLESVSDVITISANLDIYHWTDQHNYTRLYGSLNPLNEPPLNKTIQQIHLLGAEDQNIDTYYLLNQLADKPSVKVYLIPNFNHHCCWISYWPEFIKQFSTDKKPAN
jgi:hypothetical protein